MFEKFSVKELYYVTLKATYNMKIGEKTYEQGEIITLFDNISISNFAEIVKKATSNGGYDNRALITWESTKELGFNFSSGVFNLQQLALMTNNKMEERQDSFSVTQLEERESNGEGVLKLKYTPNGDNIFIFEKETNKKVVGFKVESNSISNLDFYKDYIITYNFNYLKTYNCVEIGKELFNGYVEMEGRTRIKDENGIVKTGILKIPKLRLDTNLFITIGKTANPMVANFNATGYPVGGRGDSKVMEIIMLDEDLDSDV